MAFKNKTKKSIRHGKPWLLKTKQKNLSDMENRCFLKQNNPPVLENFLFKTKQKNLSGWENRRFLKQKNPSDWENRCFLK